MQGSETQIRELWSVCLFFTNGHSAVQTVEQIRSSFAMIVEIKEGNGTQLTHVRV